MDWLSRALHFFRILIKWPQQKIALEGRAPRRTAKQNIYLQNSVLSGENIGPNVPRDLISFFRARIDQNMKLPTVLKLYIRNKLGTRNFIKYCVPSAAQLLYTFNNK